MAAGLIVIATNAYGPAEIIDNGKDSLLFERGNPQAMAQCIIELLNSPLHIIEDMRNQAMKKIATRYEISLVKNEVEIIMENQIRKAKMRLE
jgi:glycosyltransferase involved in cell wall biosynthesis